MDIRCLLVIEVSQKQAFIFKSSKLKENIENSKIIELVTSPNFFAIESDGLFIESENLVYSGGGHAVLEFESETKAKEFANKISYCIKCKFNNLEIFIKIKEYDENISPRQNVEKLIKNLEEKKTIRKMAFRQGTFGIEKIDEGSFAPNIKKESEEESTNENNKGINFDEYNLNHKNSCDSENDFQNTIFNLLFKDEYLHNYTLQEKQEEIEDCKYKKYIITNRFDDLGAEKGTYSYLAFIHIDGNSMGKRVSEFRDALDSSKGINWDSFKNYSKKFSHEIDKHFKESYIEMLDEVINNITNQKLDELKLEDNVLPIRNIILAGDDVTFVTDGRIGLECARIFLEKLSKKTNSCDGRKYSACAGIAIVHNKFPFYRAYDIAESLCSNAKKMIAEYNKYIITDSSDNEDRKELVLSAMDWQIVKGEYNGTLEQVRKLYDTYDGSKLELRPYIVPDEKNISQVENYRDYNKFKKLVEKLQEKRKESENIDDISKFVARSKIKELRSYLRQGEDTAEYFIKSNKMDNFALVPINSIYNEIYDSNKILNSEGLPRILFDKTKDGANRCLIFDAIEIEDDFISLI